MRSFVDVLIAVPEGLTYEMMRSAVDMILEQEVPDEQIAAFLFGLRARGERTDEIRGFVDSLRDRSAVFSVDGQVLDIVGTGGDRTGAINISTPSSVVAATVLRSHGISVVKHGNRGQTTRTGSADIVEQFGIPLDLTIEQVHRVLDAVGISFCFAPAFHPALKALAPVRKKLGVPTLVNLLAPMLNPASPTYQLVGVADGTRMDLIASALKTTTKRSVVARGRDGLDKFTTTTATDYILIVDGAEFRGNLVPQELGLDVSSLRSLAGSSPEANASQIRAVLDGEGDPMVSDVVALNAAVAAWLAIGTGTDLVTGTREYLPTVQAAMRNGAAGFLLAEWQTAASRERGPAGAP